MAHLLKTSHGVLRAELAEFRGRPLRTPGDGLMATFDGPARAIKFATSAREKIRELGLQLRAGLHTGECELIGNNMRGTAVNIAAWVASLANPDEVLLSSTVKDLVAGSNLQLAVLQSGREPLSTGRQRPNAVAYAGPLAAIRTMDQKAADIALPSAIGSAATNHNSSTRDGVTLVTCAITCWFDIPRSTSALIS